MRRSAETPLRPQGVEIVSGTRLTQWEYDQQRGWLEEKVYPNASTGNPGANKITYTYTGAGRLNSRTWARGVITQYGYKKRQSGRI